MQAFTVIELTQTHTRPCINIVNPPYIVSQKVHIFFISQLRKEKRRADSKLAKCQNMLEVIQNEKNQLHQKVYSLIVLF